MEFLQRKLRFGACKVEKSGKKWYTAKNTKILLCFLAENLSGIDG